MSDVRHFEIRAGRTVTAHLCSMTPIKKRKILFLIFVASKVLLGKTVPSAIPAYFLFGGYFIIYTCKI